MVGLGGRSRELNILDRKVEMKNNKLRDLIRLQNLQITYLDRVDFDIETRSDQHCTAVRFTSWPKESGIHVFKLDWFQDNKYKLIEIQRVLDRIPKRRPTE